jgi:alkylation response protein AidB-like acyl-CoA dehydrogenase
MDFALNEEQRMLQASARRFFADHHPLARARRALPWADVAQPQLWADMAAMGWMALLLPEAHDGLDLGLVEASLVAEEAGRQLVNLPWASSAVLLALWFKAAPHAAPLALHDAVQGAVAGARALHCVADTDAWWDFAGQCSDIVVVRGWHDASRPLQIALAQSSALPSRPALDPTLRQAPSAQATLDWHTLDIPPEARDQARLAHRLVRAAELVGVAQAALEMAAGYARERVQFGKPIGSYQAIKHQLANAWMGVDNARLSVWYAAAALDGGLPDARFACAVADFTAIEGALQSTRTALQVHGGMGFTWEHDAHLYLKRAQHLAARLGGASHALGVVEELALA